MQLPVAVCSERNLSDGYGPGPGCRPAAVAFFRTGAAQSGPCIVRGSVSADRQAGMRAVCPGNEAEASRAEPSRVNRGVSGLETLTLAGQPGSSPGFRARMS